MSPDADVADRMGRIRLVLETAEWLIYCKQEKLAVEFLKWATRGLRLAEAKP